MATVDTVKKRKAPWKDYAGNDIYEGDTVILPDGTCGVVFFDDTVELVIAKWRVDYGILGTPRLIGQITENDFRVLPSCPPQPAPKHSHYFKDVSKLDQIDVYRVLTLFEVTDPCLQHAIKKLLVAGGRGAKGFNKDVQEAIDALLRCLEMRREGVV